VRGRKKKKKKKTKNKKKEKKKKKKKTNRKIYKETVNQNIIYKKGKQ